MAILQQDIPKFFPWISQTVVEEWESFMADLPNKVTESGDSGGWIMEEVFQLLNKQLLLPLPAIQCKTVYWLTCSQLSKLPARYKFYITTHTSTQLNAQHKNYSYSCRLRSPQYYILRLEYNGLSSETYIVVASRPRR